MEGVSKMIIRKLVLVLITVVTIASGGIIERNVSNVALEERTMEVLHTVRGRVRRKTA